MSSNAFKYVCQRYGIGIPVLADVWGISVTQARHRADNYRRINWNQYETLAKHLKTTVSKLINEIGEIENTGNQTT